MILALDTSTIQASAALLSDAGEPIAARQARVTTHSEELLTLVDDLLRSQGIAPTALTGIACGAGPGSFTGLRIGLATAKGLCFALGRPLVLVSSLAALAHRGLCRAPPGTLGVAAIDAFKGEVYAGFYRLATDGSLVLMEPDTVLAPAALAARLAAAVATTSKSHAEGDSQGGGPVHLIGDVLSAWPILAVPGVDISETGPPHATNVGRLAAARLLAGSHDDLAAAIPAYIRVSEAETKREQAMIALKESI